MATGSATYDAHDHKPGFFRRWFLSTNHKDIGTLYLLFSLLMFLIGGAMAMIIRLELFEPGIVACDGEATLIAGVRGPGHLVRHQGVVPATERHQLVVIPRLGDRAFLEQRQSLFVVLRRLGIGVPRTRESRSRPHRASYRRRSVVDRSPAQ